jgi:P27 family predicted phage terminase small subunit
MAGRRRLPPFLKVIKGTNRPRKTALKPPSLGPPQAPGFLSPAARQVWDEQAPLLFKLGVVTQLDAGVLAAFCTAFARWQTAEAILAQVAADDDTGMAGLVVTTKTGRTIPHPMLAICRAAQTATMRYAVELGLTPSSRSRIHADPPLGDDPGSKYLT